MEKLINILAVLYVAVLICLVFPMMIHNMKEEAIQNCCAQRTATGSFEFINKCEEKP